MAVMLPMARPSTMTCDRRSLVGLSSTGFMRTSGSSPAACACMACARPISAPSLVTKEFNAMFCALKGATSQPSCFKMRSSAAQSTLFPTDEAVPCTIRLFPRMCFPLFRDRRSLALPQRR